MVMFGYALDPQDMWTRRRALDGVPSQLVDASTTTVVILV